MLNLTDESHTAYAVASCVVLYLLLVRSLRYRRKDAVREKYPERASYRSMTLDDAFVIQSRLSEVEFPTTFSNSVFFALFKTYGIPSISRLLVTTGQLAKSETASKRVADTGVILTEVVLHNPSSPRAIDGIARMNYLHGLYRKSGKISDDDMLYTLSLFVLEPIRWTARFEWRSLSEVERCAMGTYWKYVGDAMEIPYSALKSCKEGWTDGLDFLHELEEWSTAYEAGHMLPAESNQTIAQGTIDIALNDVPKALHGAGLDIINVLLEPRLRKAMLFNKPSWLADRALALIVSFRKFLLRHLFLPRPYFLRRRWFSEDANSHGRFNAERFISHPWYVAPTFYARWGVKALVLRLLGGTVPGDDGGKYVPEGYLIAEVGPDAMSGKGEAHMQATREKLLAETIVGCPFRRP